MYDLKLGRKPRPGSIPSQLNPANAPTTNFRPRHQQNVTKISSRSLSLSLSREPRCYFYFAQTRCIANDRIPLRLRRRTSKTRAQLQARFIYHARVDGGSDYLHIEFVRSHYRNRCRNMQRFFGLAHTFHPLCDG